MREKKDLFSVLSIGFVIFLMVLVMVCSVKHIGVSTSKLGAEVEVPFMRIELNNLSIGGLNSSEKTVKYGGNDVEISYGDRVVAYENVEIKTRGNSTWGLPKMSYQLKFNSGVSLLGFPKLKKWVLLANYLDKTQLRNDAAFYLAKMLDDDFPLYGDFVELDINGGYLGTYYVVNKIAINKNTIDLRDNAGIIVELDNLRSFEHRCYYTSNHECLALTDAVNDEIASISMDKFAADFDKAEKAAASKDYETVEDILDMESFAKYFLVNEFAVNPDAYSASYYMYRDGEEDKIHAGPVWDFDYSFGNKAWYWAIQDDFYSPYRDLVREVEVRGGSINKSSEQIELKPDKMISHLLYDLMEMPEFKKVVRKIFNERMAGREKEFLQHIKMRAQSISEAVERNNDRWAVDDMDSEFEYFLDWVEKRYLHFEEMYGGSDDNTRLPMI